MSVRLSRICLTVYGVLFVLSFFLLSVPGDRWLWYAIMVPFAVVPLFSSQRAYRLAGLFALLIADLLIANDVVAGKRFRDRIREMPREAATLRGGGSDNWTRVTNRRGFYRCERAGRKVSTETLT